VIWRSLTAQNANSALTATTAGKPAAIGTCVETLDDDGLTLAAGLDTEGNYAICHWFYVMARSETTGTKAGGRAQFDWGETRYLTEFDWGTAGSNISGTRVMTLGSAIGAEYGFALSETTALATYVVGAIYSQSWYQPKYATSYKASALRRYHGGENFGSKVKGYCIGLHELDNTEVNTDVTAAAQAGVAGVVTLSGAFALTAGVIAFGTACLAF